jgi:Mce-associated membrane protein
VTPKPAEPHEEQEDAAVPVDSDETTDNTEATSTEAADTETAETEAAENEAAETEAAETEAAAEPGDAEASTFAKVVAFALLPAVALLLAAAAGFLKWQDDTVRTADVAAIESTQVAKDATVRLLSYKPDTVAQDLGSARDLLTGEFKDSYTTLTEETVIPGAQQQKISAVVNVPAVASISATPERAEALVFVNQTVIIGDGAPTATASSVKVTLDKIDGRWLISGFDPV